MLGSLFMAITILTCNAVSDVCTAPATPYRVEATAAAMVEPAELAIVDISPMQVASEH